jgi:hypothetical protein
VKKTSTEPSDWWRQKIDEALAAPRSRVEEPPPLPYPASASAGASDLFEILVVIESFGLPAPSRDRIEYTTLLL